MCIWHTEIDSERERKKDRNSREIKTNHDFQSPEQKKKKKNAAKKYSGPLFQKLLNVDLKNIHNLEVESYVLFGGNFFGFQTWETEFQVTLKKLFWGGRGKSQVMQKFATRVK